MDSFTLDKVEFDAVRRILAGFCRCSLGAAVARHIGPTTKADLARQWLAKTTEMVDAVRQVGLPPVGGVADLTETLTRATPGGHPSGEDMALIASTLEATGLVRNYLNALPEKLELLHELGGDIAEFEREIEAIRAVVASDGSVLDTASGRLNRLRQEIGRLDRQIQDVIYGYLRRPEVARLLQDQNVTLHDDRYVLPVRSENRGRLPGVVHRTSGSGATVFVEPSACVEMNNHLADLRDDERTEIVRLLNELTVKVTARAEDIARTLRTIAQVDLIAAKAQYAYQFDMTCPVLTDAGPLEFAQARHPLLIDQAWQQQRDGVPAEERHPVVPIDIRLGSDFDVLVITGSNTGGKTLSLKTAGLLVLMAQSGLHVPARGGATMPVFKEVLIDVGDEQSLQQSLSTFGAHMTRLKYILGKAGSKALVLLDELGAGTDPDEGAAIGQAVLDELQHKKCLAMITTHLSVLKAYAFSHDRVDNASVEFDTKTLRPTYHLRIGTPGESHAIVVAEGLGLDPRLIASARGHLPKQGRQFNKAIRATGAARRQAEDARAEAKEAQLTADERAKRYQLQMDELTRVRGDFEAWLAHLPTLKPGDEIYVPPLGKAARLVRLEMHKQQIVVDSGSLQVEVSLRDMMPDFGQTAIRAELESMRREIRQHLHTARHTAEQATNTEQRRRKAAESLRRREQDFAAWAGSIRNMAVGDVVPITREPGKATVVSADLEHMTVTVSIGQEEFTLPMAQIFPKRRVGAKPKRAAKAQRTKADKPMPRQQPSRRKRGDQYNREKLLQTEPGGEVFVVPFDRKATLVRFDIGKGMAVVLAGNFEMQVPLADLRPVHPPAPPAPSPTPDDPRS